MKKSKLSLYFIFIAFFTFISIFFAIVQTSYSNLIGPIKKVQESTLTKPINPKLDTDILDQIQNRPDYQDDNINLSSPPTDENSNP